MSAQQPLLSCGVCGRTFSPEALSKHQPICKKLSSKKRRVFDSSKQRAEGTEILTLKKTSLPKKQPVKKSTWRQQHEDFINAIRSAKLATKAIKEGRPLPPPPPPSINPDYIQCPYCLRRFNEAAAERHINFCKDQVARRTVCKPPVQKTSKLALRTQPSTPNNKEPVTGLRRPITLARTQSKPVTGGNSGNGAVKSFGSRGSSSGSVTGKGAAPKSSTKEY